MAGRAALVSDRQLAIEIATQRIRPSKQTLTAGGHPQLSAAHATLSGVGGGTSAVGARHDAEPALKFDAGSGTHENDLNLQDDYVDDSPQAAEAGAPPPDKEALFITQEPIGIDDPPMSPTEQLLDQVVVQDQPREQAEDSDTARAGSDDSKPRRRAVTRAAQGTLGHSSVDPSDVGYPYRIDMYGPEFDFASQDRNLQKIKKIFQETSTQQ